MIFLPRGRFLQILFLLRLSFKQRFSEETKTLESLIPSTEAKVRVLSKGLSNASQSSLETMRHSQEVLGVYRASLSKRQTLLGRIKQVCLSEAGGGAVSSATGNRVAPLPTQSAGQAMEDVELRAVSGGVIEGKGTALSSVAEVGKGGDPPQ